MTLAPIRQPLTVDQEFESEAARCAAAFDAMCRLKGYTAALTRTQMNIARAVERNRGSAQDQGWVA